MIGPPKDDIITPKEKIAGGKMLQYLSPLTPEMPIFTLEIVDGGKYLMGGFGLLAHSCSVNDASKLHLPEGSL